MRMSPSETDDIQRQFQAVEKRRNAKWIVVAHRVPWTLDGKQWKKSFSVAAQAASFRSELMAAARKGEVFDLDTGLPTSWSRLEAMTWYVLTLRYTDVKWPYASPNHRRGIAEALTDATEVLLLHGTAFSREDLRAALRCPIASEFGTALMSGKPPGAGTSQTPGSR